MKLAPFVSYRLLNARVFLKASLLVAVIMGLPVAVAAEVGSQEDAPKRRR